MKTILALLFGLVLSFPQDNDKNQASGNWEGKIEGPGVSLKIIFHIVNNDGVLSATMDSPDQNAFGIKMDEVKFNNGVLEMVNKQYGGTYKGTLKEEKFIGKWSQSGQSFDLELKRIKRTGTS